MHHQLKGQKGKSSLLSWNFIGKSGPNRPIEWEQHSVSIYSRAISKEDKTVDVLFEGRQTDILGCWSL